MMYQPKSTRIQGEPSIKQLEKDSYRLFFGLGPTFSLSSSGTSSSPPTNLGRSVSSQLTLPGSVRPDQYAVVSHKTTERSASSLIRSDKEVGHQFTDTQRYENTTSNTGRTSYSMSSTSQGLKLTSDVDSSSIAWPLIGRRDTKDEPPELYSFAQQVDGVQSIPGLDLDEIPASTISTVPSGTSPLRFTAESAENLLLNFGLEKEDLVGLAAYPEKEITPDTLPLILHQICNQKQKRAAGNSSELHTSTSMSLKSSLDSEVTIKNQNKMPKSILKPSKVFEDEHPDKCVIVKDEIGKTSRDCGVGGATSDNQKISGCSKKSLLKSVTQLKSTSLSSKKGSVVHPERDPTKQLQIKPKRQIKNTKPLKSKASKNHSLTEPGCLSVSKSKKSYKSPGSLELKSSNSEKRKMVVEERKHQQTKQNYVQQKAKILVKHEAERHDRLESKMVRLSSKSSQQFVVKNAVSKKPLLPTPNIHRLPFSPSSHQLLCKGTHSQGRPAPYMVNDYAATTPRVFPHTCCLCNKECAHMQDWLSHQKTSIHLEKLRLLHNQCREWGDDDRPSLSSNSSQRRRTSPSLSTSQTSQHCHQKTRRESHSWSRSPLRSHSPEGRRDKSRSSFCSNTPPSSSSHSHQLSQAPRHGLKGQFQKHRSESQSSSPRPLCGSKDRRGSRRSQSPHQDAQGSLKRKKFKCDGKRISNNEEVDDVQYIPGLGEIPVSNRSTVPSGTSPPRFTAESAENLLLDFGLEKQDLADLAFYPEDEITADTLPFILRQIRIQKQKRAAAELNPNTSSQNCVKSEGPAVKMPKSILKPSKVTDYEHPDKFSIIKDEVGKTRRNCSGVGGAALLPVKQKPSGCSKKSLLKSVTQLKSTSLSSKKGSVVHPGRNPTKQVQIKPKGKIKNTKPLKSKASKKHPLTEPEPGCLSASKPPKSCSKRLGSLQLKSSKSEIKKRKTVLKKRKRQMKQNYVHYKETKQTQVMIDVKYLVASTKAVPPPSSLQPVFERTHPTDLPTSSMVNDYAATTPRVFPHTCCLCNKQCAHMQDWLSHQNTSFHLESCRVLRKTFPMWDGEVLQFLSNSSSSRQTSQYHQKTRRGSRSPSPFHHHGFERRRDDSRSSSRSSSPWSYYSSRSPSYSHSPDSYRGLKDQWHRSRSRSPSTSPHHYWGSRDRRDRSRSPYSFRGTHRSPSPWSDRPTSSHYRSRSRSHERRPSFSRRDEEWSSPRRNYGQQFSPERVDEKGTSPRRSHERRLSTEKSVPQQMSSCSTERLTKKLLETSAAQSLLNHSDLEGLVKTLTPVILAEIDKMSSPSSSTSSNNGGELKAATPPP